MRSFGFHFIFPVEILPGAEQALEEIGCLYEVGAVVLAAEGDRLSGRSVHPVRESAVVGVRLQQEVDHMQQELRRGIAADPFAIGGGDDGHHAKAGAAGGHDFVAVVKGLVAAFTGHMADGVGKVPEIPKGLVFCKVDEGRIAEVLWAAPGPSAARAGRWACNEKAKNKRLNVNSVRYRMNILFRNEGLKSRVFAGLSVSQGSS
ncbi:hypothetical protein ACQ86N_45885 [Puia sp. P3]|uniref:hypothetical protein n=1 Tax=Puia sp. P3 TaxID=3423952 RepID=UPI003D66626C